MIERHVAACCVEVEPRPLDVAVRAAARIVERADLRHGRSVHHLLQRHARLESPRAEGVRVGDDGVGGIADHHPGLDGREQPLRELPALAAVRDERLDHVTRARGHE